MPTWPVKGWSNSQVISPWSLESVGLNICYGATGINALGGTVVTQNKIYYVPFSIFNSPWTAKRMFVYNGVTVAGNIDVGIYDRFGGKIVSMGSTAMAGASALQWLDITDTTIAPGLYFMAFVSDSATATFFTRAISLQVQRGAFVREQLATFALPTTAAFVVPTTSTLPAFGMSSRTF